MFNDEGPLFQDNDDQKALQALNEAGELAVYEEEPEQPVSLDYIPAFPAFPVMAEEQLAYVLLNMRTAKGTNSADRTPLNVCLVLDQSSSMRGDKLYAVKNAARHVIDQLTVADYFSLVSFNDRATVVVSCQRVSSREALKQLVDSIEGKGGTELANGLYAGIAEMRPATSFTPLNYILLLTDGQTYGDADRCVQLGQEAARHRIVIHPMGVGTDWNEDLLETVAARSGGASEYIESADKIVSIFMQKIGQLRSTLTQTSSLRFEPDHGTRLKQVYRVTPNIAELSQVETQDGATEVNLGPLSKGIEYSLLMEILIPGRQPGIQRIGNVSVTFSSPGSPGALKQVELPLGLNFAANTGGISIDPDVKAIVDKVTTFKLQNRAWQDIAAGDIPSGTKRLAAVSTRLLAMGELELSQQVQQEVQNLQQRGVPSSQGKKRIKYGTRGLTNDFLD
ncbi:MAG TPA: VWA domain-containing protein [Chloroflexia bacterium]|nr:VWA domain-containing protein [Chloroflexia bacterium]